MPTKTDVLSKARGDLGVREVPDGSNRTSIGAWFGWNGVAWCAMSVSKWLITGGFAIKKNAGAHELAAYLVKLGWQKVAPAAIVSGDVVLFDWSHIGICEARNSATSIITIEGNTGNACKRMSRANTSIAYGVRPPYEVEAPPVPTKPTPTPPATGTKYPLNAKRGEYFGVGQHVSSGNQVKRIQRAVGADDDGIYGPDTHLHVERAQKRHGITQDGVVGPTTWKHLGL